MMCRWIGILIISGFFFHAQVYAEMQWMQMDVPESYQTAIFYDIWGPSDDNLFMVGETIDNAQSIILRDTGSDWKKMNNDAFSGLRCVWGSSASDIFVGGDGNTILHYTGSGWHTMEHANFSKNICEDIWGTSGSNVYAVGSGRILLYDGDRWQIISPTSMLDDDFTCIWGTSGSNLFVGGSYYDSGEMNYLIMHYDGTLWTEVASGSGGSLLKMWGSSEKDIYAVGQPGVLHFNGTSWVKIEDVPDLSSDVSAIWGASATDVFAAKSDGRLFSYNGNTWQELATGNDQEINNIWGLSASSVYAVGENGTTLHYADDAATSTSTDGSGGGGCFISTFFR